jgi:hypothetical protein
MATAKKPKKLDIYTRTDFDPEVAEEICRILSEGVKRPVPRPELPAKPAGDDSPHIKDIEKADDHQYEEQTVWLNVTEVCAEVGITTRTLRVWLARYLEFREQYDVARELYVDHLLEEAIEISNGTTAGDVYVVETKGGDIKLKPYWDNVNRDKLRVETLLKVASKMDPARYGDKIQISSTNTHVHIDETREGKLLRFRNMIEEAKKKGYGIKDIFAELGLSEVNLLPADFRPITQGIGEKMLESPQSIRIDRFAHKGETV